MAQGTPEDIASSRTYTGEFLRQVLDEKLLIDDLKVNKGISEKSGDSNQA